MAAKHVDEALDIALKANAADRGGDDLRAAGVERVEQDLLIGIAGRAGDEARIELCTGNYERIHHGMFLPDKPLAANARATAARNRQSGWRRQPVAGRAT